MNILFDYIIALTNLNGVISKEKVVEIYNMQNETAIDTKEIEELINKKETALRKQSVLVKHSYFVHDSSLDVDEINDLLQRKANKPYYIPNKDLLLRYKDDEFYEETKQTKKLYRFLKKYVHPDNVNSVEDVFYDVLVSCQLEEEPIDIINYLEQINVIFPTEQELSEALHIIIDLYNHTKLWSNNGFTPKEISDKFEKPSLKLISNNTSIDNNKIGRNDPCPCGSGKKYKKCCL